MRNNTSLAYQSAAADGATHIGLLVIVYNAIAGYLLRSAEAVRANDIELRCSSSGHVLLLLGHLESWLDCIDDAAIVASLRAFYAMLRARILQLQAAPQAHQFEELASLVSETRATWEAKERGVSAAAHRMLPLEFAQQSAHTDIGSRKLTLNA